MDDLPTAADVDGFNEAIGLSASACEGMPKSVVFIISLNMLIYLRSTKVIYPSTA